MDVQRSSRLSLPLYLDDRCEEGHCVGVLGSSWHGAGRGQGWSCGARDPCCGAWDQVPFSVTRGRMELLWRATEAFPTLSTNTAVAVPAPAMLSPLAPPKHGTGSVGSSSPRRARRLQAGPSSLSRSLQDSPVHPGGHSRRAASAALTFWGAEGAVILTLGEADAGGSPVRGQSGHFSETLSPPKS